MGGEKIKADEAASVFREEIQKKVNDLKAKGIIPKIVGFLATQDAGSIKYAEWTGKACEIDGISYEVRTVDKMELEDKLHEAIDDPKVHGIMIYYPCFGMAPSFYGGSMDDYLRDSIPIEKDVEGLCDTYRRNLYRNIRYIDSHTQQYKGGIIKKADSAGTKKCLLPCTPLAIVKILEHLKVYDETVEVGDRLKGKKVCVVNRSEIVGRPLAAMLANDGADVYSIDISSAYLMKRGKITEMSETPEQLVRQADIIITGVPTKDYRLPSEWIQPGAVVMNVSHFKNVDEASLLEIDNVKYCPLVGKVTVAMLERNLLRLIDNFHS